MLNRFYYNKLRLNKYLLFYFFKKRLFQMKNFVIFKSVPYSIIFNWNYLSSENYKRFLIYLNSLSLSFSYGPNFVLLPSVFNFKSFFYISDNNLFRIKFFFKFLTSRMVQFNSNKRIMPILFKYNSIFLTVSFIVKIFSINSLNSLYISFMNGIFLNLANFFKSYFILSTLIPALLFGFFRNIFVYIINSNALNTSSR